MQRDYDLFEVLSDGALMWREMVRGHEDANQKLVELSKRTANEVRVMHVLTNSLIASMNRPKA
jgi:hypothetical protein